MADGNAYRVLRTLAEAEAALVGAAGDTLLIAGGTDLMVRAHPAVRDHALLDVAQVDELRRITLTAGELILGAGITYTECLTEPVIRRACPLLTAVAARFASPQIRNVATLGGNVANASPAGDGVAALWALDAVVDALTPAGAVRLPIDAIVVGPGRLGVPPRSILTAFHVPAAEPGDGSAFYKLVNRAWPEHPMAISLASVAARVRLDAEGRVTLARVVLGAVAPTPVRAAPSEAALVGHAPTAALIARAAALATRAASPVSDVRAAADYRRDVLPALVTTALEAAFEAARSTTGGPSG